MYDGDFNKSWLLDSSNMFAFFPFMISTGKGPELNNPLITGAWIFTKPKVSPSMSACQDWKFGNWKFYSHEPSKDVSIALLSMNFDKRVTFEKCTILKDAWL